MTLLARWNQARLGEGRVTDAELDALFEENLDGLGACGAPAARHRWETRRDLDAIVTRSEVAFERARAAFVALAPEQSSPCVGLSLPVESGRARVGAAAREAERAAALAELLEAKHALEQAHAIDHRLSAYFWTGLCGH